MNLVEINAPSESPETPESPKAPRDLDQIRAARNEQRWRAFGQFLEGICEPAFKRIVKSKPNLRPSQLDQLCKEQTAGLVLKHAEQLYEHAERLGLANEMKLRSLMAGYVWTTMKFLAYRFMTSTANFEKAESRYHTSAQVLTEQWSNINGKALALSVAAVLDEPEGERTVNEKYLVAMAAAWAAAQDEELNAGYAVARLNDFAEKLAELRRQNGWLPGMVQDD